MWPIVLTSTDEFWNALLYGSGSWLYIVLIAAICILVSVKFRWFGIVGVFVGLFSILNLETYATANLPWTLDEAYKIVLFGILIILEILIMFNVISDSK